MSSLHQFEYNQTRSQRLRRRFSRLFRRSGRPSPAAVTAVAPRLGPLGAIGEADNKPMQNNFGAMTFQFESGSLENLKLSFDTATSGSGNKSKSQQNKRASTFQINDYSRPATLDPGRPEGNSSFYDPVPSTRKPLSQQSTNGRVRDQNDSTKSGKPLQSHPVGKKQEVHSMLNPQPPKTSPTARERRSSLPKNMSTAVQRTNSKRNSEDRTPLAVNKKRATDRPESMAATTSSLMSRNSVHSESDRASQSRASTGPRVIRTDPITTLPLDDPEPEQSARAPSSSVQSKRASFASSVATRKTSLGSLAGAAGEGSSSSARRFEVKSAALLKPVGTNDRSARDVSATIAKLNRNSIGGSTAPTSAPRQIDTGASSSRRSVTDSVKSVNKPDDHVPNRRFSQPSIRNSYESRRSLTPPQSDIPDAMPRPRRGSSRSRVSERMSWLQDLDNQSKNPGRDHVFRKLEGGVAAKLAAFEQKSVTPAAGVSRSNSVSSRVDSSDLYNPELNKLKRQSTHEVMSDDQFKKKLEGVAGNIVEKVQKNTTAPESEKTSSSRWRPRGADKVPQDVLDVIALSGVDQETAIDEYLQRGTFGKTTTWDLEQMRKEIEVVSGENTPVVEKSQTLAIAQESTPVKEASTEKKPLAAAPLAKEASLPSPVPEKVEEKAIEAAPKAEADSEKKPLAAAPLAEEAVKATKETASLPTPPASGPTQAKEPKEPTPTPVEEPATKDAVPTSTASTTPAPSEPATAAPSDPDTDTPMSKVPTLSASLISANSSRSESPTTPTFNAASLPAFKEPKRSNPTKSETISETA